MRFRADEQIVHGIHGLAVVQCRLGHGHRLGLSVSAHNFRHHLCQVAEPERQERPSQRSGSGFTPTTGWPLRYFNVLATNPSWPSVTTVSSGANTKFGRKPRSTIWTRPTCDQRRLSLGQSPMIRLVLAEIIREVRALMLDVESGLADGVEPDHQFSQARRSRHEDDLVVGQPMHFRVRVSVCGVH